MADIFDDIFFVDDSGKRRYRSLINGCWTCLVSESFFPVSDPANGEIFAYVPDCSLEDVKGAIRAAKGFHEMRHIPPLERLEILERAGKLVLEHGETLAAIITRESGKPISIARGEVKATAERLKLVMEEVRVLYGEYLPGEWCEDTKNKFAIVLRKPLGLVAAISPFNYPLFIAAAKIIPAILAGNTVIAKPASDTPLSLLYFVRILEVAGVPAGAINLITGRGSSVGDAIVSDPDVDAVSFTGSTGVGEHIAAIAGIKKLHLELGGKASAIVLEDADLDLAAAQVCRGAFRNSGQRCDAVSRVLVVESVREIFTAKVVAEARKYTVGAPSDPATQLGTVINEKARQRIQALLDDALAQGATLLVGGGCKGLFFEATVLGNVSPQMRIAVEEIFGPILPIISVKDARAAVELSNSSEYGLDSCLFTRDIDQALGIARELEDGAVTVNAAPAHGVGHFPFGGNKKSGLGREGIKYSIDELTKLHTIIITERERP